MEKVRLAERALATVSHAFACPGNPVMEKVRPAKGALALVSLAVWLDLMLTFWLDGCS